MRSPNQLVHSRARLRGTLCPVPAGRISPLSRLPSFLERHRGPRARRLPALGAGFAQYLLEDTGRRRHAVRARWTGGSRRSCTSSGPARRCSSWKAAASAKLDARLASRLIPPGTAAAFSVERQRTTLASCFCSASVYEPAERSADLYKPLHSATRLTSPPSPGWDNNEHARLQTLIPDELTYDLAMNIFTFDPGFGLPYVETHVMEHGASDILQGRGSTTSTATGWRSSRPTSSGWARSARRASTPPGRVPAKYIYYKNVNREVPSYDPFVSHEGTKRRRRIRTNSRATCLRAFVNSRLRTPK